MMVQRGNMTRTTRREMQMVRRRRRFERVAGGDVEEGQGRPRITRSVTRGRRVPGEKINGLRPLCVNVIRLPCTRIPVPCSPSVRPQWDITRSNAGNTVRSAGCRFD